MDVAKILGISRVAVFKRIKNGQMKAEKVGKSYVIDRADLNQVLGTTLTHQDKENIDRVVKKTVREYGETLRLLGKE